MKRLITLTVVIGLAVLLSHCLSDSDYVNCVVAADPASFTGERLKNDGRVASARLPTTECLARDREFDGGDGNNSGRVRWVVCLNGPDCDEAGMF